MSEAGKSQPAPTPSGSSRASEPSRGTSPPPEGSAQPPQVSIDTFRQIVIRVGVITAAQDHPNADRLLVLTVDVGDGTPRQLVAGIKGAYQATEVIGKRVIVVTNLKPALLRGIESQGMVLAASDASSIVLISPERPLPAGSPVK